jgi:hypothetical protein
MTEHVKRKRLIRLLDFLRCEPRGVHQPTMAEWWRALLKLEAMGVPTASHKPPYIVLPLYLTALSTFSSFACVKT